MKNYLPLSLNETENKIMDWAHNHADKLQLIEKKRVKLHTNGYLNNFLEIKIVPKNARALPVSFAIGGLLELDIQFGDYYHITYGEYNINAVELDTILKSYLLGDYFVIRWMFDEEIIRGEFYIGDSKGDYINGFATDFKKIERNDIRMKLIRFLAKRKDKLWFSPL